MSAKIITPRLWLPDWTPTWFAKKRQRDDTGKRFRFGWGPSLGKRMYSEDCCCPTICDVEWIEENGVTAAMQIGGFGDATCTYLQTAFGACPEVELTLVEHTLSNLNGGYSTTDTSPIVGAGFTVGDPSDYADAGPVLISTAYGYGCGGGDWVNNSITETYVVAISTVITCAGCEDDDRPYGCLGGMEIPFGIPGNKYAAIITSARWTWNPLTSSPSGLANSIAYGGLFQHPNDGQGCPGDSDPSRCTAFYGRFSQNGHGRMEVPGTALPVTCYNGTSYLANNAYIDVKLNG